MDETKTTKNEKEKLMSHKELIETKSFIELTIRENGSRRVMTHNLDPSKTDQSFADEIDVNDIIRKHQQTGQITHLAKVAGQYSDVSEIPDLDIALQQIMDADKAFRDLPSALRTKFQNKPENMLRYLSDPANFQEAIDLGLKSGVKTADLPKPEATAPVKEVTDGKTPEAVPVPTKTT